MNKNEIKNQDTKWLEIIVDKKLEEFKKQMEKLHETDHFHIKYLSRIETLYLVKEIINDPIKVDMNPVQGEIYRLLIGEICALHSELNLSSRSYLRDLGKPILRLLMFLSNPNLSEISIAKLSKYPMESL